MDNASILESTKKFLEEAPFVGESIDTKVLHLLCSEYLRHIGQYRRVDLLMQQKYGMTFEKFISQKVVREKKYSWDVETDAMEWETAISGIKTMERKIKELRKEGCVSTHFWNRSCWRRSLALTFL